MNKLLIVIAAFAVTISTIWVVTSRQATTPQALPDSEQAQQANIYVQSGSLPAKKTATATLASSPTKEPAPTVTILTPLVLITPSPTPTHTPTSIPVPSHTPTPTSTATPVPSTTPTATPTPAPTATPTPPPAGGITILSLTSPVAQKGKAHILIKSAPVSPCTIVVTLPSGGTSSSKDLAPTTSDNEGLASWSWGINWNTKPGTAKINLACTSNDNHYSGQTTMEIIPSQ